MRVNSSKIDEYINEICSHVKFKQARNEIREELLDHFQEKIEHEMTLNITEDEFIEKAIKDMGNAELIGKQLNETHKGKPKIGIIILTIVLSAIGLSVAYSLGIHKLTLSSGIFYKTLLYTVIGYLLAFSLYFFDYRILERHGKKIFVFTTLILFVHIFAGNHVDGARSWITIGSISVNILEISLFLYTISLSKMLNELKWSSVKEVIYGFSMLFIPIILYMLLPSQMSIVMYSVLFLTIMILTKTKLRYIITSVGIAITSGMYYASTNPHVMKRLLMFFSPDLLNGEYRITKAVEILKSSGWIGHGFDFSNLSIPEIHTDFIFTYIVYTFGWLGGIIVTMIFLAFTVQMFLSSKKVKNKFGSLMIQGFMIIFAMKFILNILMVLGFIPIVSVNLPFISYGGTSVVIQMLSVGLILSIYRRKSLSNYYSINYKTRNLSAFKRK